MLSVLKEVRGHMANYVIINVIIGKMCKQLFLTKLKMEIILMEEQLYTKDYIKVQKN